MHALPERPLLIVVSAPSGAGKTTLCDRLLARDGRLRYSVSCTTRAPRGGERDGVNYQFLSEATFDGRIAAGDFLEHAEVHGFRYGTLRSTVVDLMQRGHDVVMDVDVQGAAQLRAAAGQAAEDDFLRRGYLDIFIAPPSMEVLRQRLESRAEDASEIIERRLANALRELEHIGAYQYLVINDEVEQSLANLRAILTAERLRLAGGLG